MTHLCEDCYEIDPPVVFTNPVSEEEARVMCGACGGKVLVGMIACADRIAELKSLLREYEGEDE